MSDLNSNNSTSKPAQMDPSTTLKNNINPATPSAVTGSVPNAISELTDNYCPICHEPINELKKTVCGHTFCLECISEWLMEAYDCPVCRTQLCPREEEAESDESEWEDEDEDEDEDADEDEGEFDDSDIGWEYCDFEEEYGIPRPDWAPPFKEIWE